MTGDGERTESLDDGESITTPGDEEQAESTGNEELPEPAEDGKITEKTENDRQTQPTEDEEITPQPPELRRQQYVVGVGAAVLAGVALAVGSVQQYPSIPTAVSIAAGIVGGGIVYWIVKHSLFPTADELSAE